MDAQNNGWENGTPLQYMAILFFFEIESDILMQIVLYVKWYVTYFPLWGFSIIFSILNLRGVCLFS